MRDTTYRAEREPYKEGDAGDIEQTSATGDPIANLKSHCSDPACTDGILHRWRAPKVCPCLYRARVARWLHEMQFEQPVDTSSLDDANTTRLLIRGSTWATTTRHLARGLLVGGISKSLNEPSPKTHRKVKVIRLSHIVDAVMKTRHKFAPFVGKMLIVRTTAGSARQKEVNAECLHEFLGFAEDNRLPVWLVDEPSERLGEKHRAWSSDVAKALDEMKFVAVEIEPAPDLDLSLLDRVDHVPPPRAELPPRPAHTYPTVHDAAALVEMPRGGGKAREKVSPSRLVAPEYHDVNTGDDDEYLPGV